MLKGLTWREWLIVVWARTWRVAVLLAFLIVVNVLIWLPTVASLLGVRMPRNPPTPTKAETIQIDGIKYKLVPIDAEGQQ